MPLVVAVSVWRARVSGGRGARLEVGPLAVALIVHGTHDVVVLRAGRKACIHVGQLGRAAVGLVDPAAAVPLVDLEAGDVRAGRCRWAPST